MILNFEHTSEQLWYELQLVKNQLGNFSSLSLLDSHSEKDNFLDLSLSFLSNLNWDSLNGGSYENVPKKVRLSLSDNLYLADFLTAASQTFFDGVINYALKNTLSGLIERLYSTKQGAFYTGLSFDNSQVPFILNGQKLSDTLSRAEIVLLCSLLDISEISINKSYWLSYRFNLEQAAKKSHIHFKLAQILEESIQQKIKAIIEPDYALADIDKTIDLGENSYALSLLVSVSLRDKDSIYTNHIEKLKDYILNYLSNTDAIDNQTLTSGCHGLIDYCQINYDQNIIDNVTDLIKKININTLKSKKHIAQLLDINCVIDRLNKKGISENEILVTQEPYTSPEINIFSGRNHELESKRQSILSSYKPNCKIFITPAILT